MKANAPEKLYVEIRHPFGNEFTEMLGFEHRGNSDDIEYTRTDAFIEKVTNFLNYKLDDIVATRVPGTIIPHHVAKQELIDDLKKYMKEE